MFNLAADPMKAPNLYTASQHASEEWFGRFDAQKKCALVNVIAVQIKPTARTDLQYRLLLRG